MKSIAPFSLPGRFLRGNLHTHSTASDGRLPLDEVIARYRGEGYDFLAVTDHFIAAYDFPVTDTTAHRDDGFTTLIAAELHTPRDAVDWLWHFVAVGLPLDFAPTEPHEDGPALARRARDAGAYVALVHPAWYGLPIDEAETIDAAHAVEIYNHGCQVTHDKGDGAYLLDGLLDRGHRLTTYACDDAHFKVDDFGGAWIELKAADGGPAAIVEALKAGAFYSTQGPRIDDIALDGDHLEIRTSAVASVLVIGAGYLASSRLGTALTRASVPLEPLAKSPWLRVVVTDRNGRRAWSNPIWKDEL